MADAAAGEKEEERSAPVEAESLQVTAQKADSLKKSRSESKSPEPGSTMTRKKKRTKSDAAEKRRSVTDPMLSRFDDGKSPPLDSFDFNIENLVLHGKGSACLAHSGVAKVSEPRDVIV